MFKRERPPASRKMHIKGNVFVRKVNNILPKILEQLTIKVRVLLPLVSIRNKVGMVDTT